MDPNVTGKVPDTLAKARALSDALELVFKYQDVLENLPSEMTISQVIEASKKAFDLASQSMTESADSVRTTTLPEIYDLTLCKDITAIFSMIDRINSAEALSGVIRSVEGLHFWQQPEILARVLNDSHVKERWGQYLRTKYSDEDEILQVFLGDSLLLELFSAESFGEFKQFFKGKVGVLVAPTHTSSDGEVVASFVHGKVNPDIEVRKLDVKTGKRQDYTVNLALPKYAKCHILREVCEKGPFGPFSEWEDHSSVYLQVHGVDLVSFKKAGLSWLPKARKKRKEELRLGRRGVNRADALLSRERSKGRPPWGQLYSILCELDEDHVNHSAG